MKEQKRYLAYSELKGASHLEISIYYSKGGANYFSGQVSSRGFYLSVTPVTKSNGIVSFTMFSGIRRLILEVKRYSDKQFHRAVELSEAIENELIAAVLEKNKAA